jgi:hypothetical protein
LGFLVPETGSKNRWSDISSSKRFYSYVSHAYYCTSESGYTLCIFNRRWARKLYLTADAYSSHILGEIFHTLRRPGPQTQAMKWRSGLVGRNDHLLDLLFESSQLFRSWPAVQCQSTAKLRTVGRARFVQCCHIAIATAHFGIC